MSHTHWFRFSRRRSDACEAESACYMTGELGDIHAGRSRILKRSGCKTMDGRFHNREHEHEQIIESWILTIIEDGGVMRYDDLHLDRIDNEWKVPNLWLPAAFHAQDMAIKIRNRHGLTLSVVVGFSLKGGMKKAGVNFKTRAQLEARFNQTPPSLYLFELGTEPWARDKIPGIGASAHNLTAERIDSAIFGKSSPLKDCWYVEFKHSDVEGYCRSVFVGEK